MWAFLFAWPVGASQEMLKFEANECLEICGGASQEELSFDAQVAAEQMEMDAEVTENGIWTQKLQQT